MYPLVFFDALRVRIRDEGTVRNKAVYLALGVAADGTREVLGLWIEQNEGAKFWLKVMNELRNRGVEDVLLAVVDGLKGFPEAITAVFPEASVQTCLVHLLRHIHRPVGEPGGDGAQHGPVHCPAGLAAGRDGELLLPDEPEAGGAGGELDGG